MIKPAEGRYKIRSAITKPTVNIKFEAGRNINRPNKNPICNCLKQKYYYYYYLKLTRQFHSRYNMTYF